MTMPSHDISEHLPVGWYIGFREYLEAAEMPESAERIGTQIAQRNETEGDVCFNTPEELEALFEFLAFKSIRSRMN